MTRIFFTTDIHGSEICFRKFVNAGKFYKADVLIMGGDCTGKMVVPILRMPNGYVSNFLDKEWHLKNEQELQDHQESIHNSGYYPVIMDQEEYEEVSSSQENITPFFQKTMVETIKRWVAYADERLDGSGIECIITPGNDDDFLVDQVIKESSKYCIAAEGVVVELKSGFELLSVGWSNPTPWHTPRECSEEELTKKIEHLASRVKSMENCIFNLHAPPYGSGLDDAPELTDDLKPLRGGAVLKPTGSIAVRDVIKKYQPMLGLHGHIHERKGFHRIGRTLCINPGSTYAEGILSGVLINVSSKKRIESYIATTG